MMLTGDKTKVNTKTSRARATTHSQGLIWDASFYDSDQVACVLNRQKIEIEKGVWRIL